MSTGRLPSVDGGIQPTIVDAKGDLIVATAADTVSRLAVGSNNNVLMADSTQSTGLKYAAEATATLTTTGDILYASAANTLARRAIGSTGDVLTVSGGLPTWAAPAGSNENWSLVNSGGTSLSGAATVTVSGITGANRLMVLINQASSANASAYIFIRINSDTGSNYNSYGINNTAASAYSASNFTKQNETTTGIRLFRMPNDATSSGSAYCLINGGNSAGVKAYLSGGGAGGGGNNAESIIVGGWYTGTSTISSISVFSDSGNLDGGTVWVYKTA